VNRDDLAKVLAEHRPGFDQIVGVFDCQTCGIEEPCATDPEAWEKFSLHLADVALAWFEEA
jgi:hypothetical protein